MSEHKNNRKDELGDRMKAYENVTRYHISPRSYVFVRVDGRAFHSYLKNSVKPFDQTVTEDMDSTAIYLCENIQNAKIGYVQSDEITILLTDFDTFTTQQFFGGNIQKITSISASMAAAKFNQMRIARQLCNVFSTNGNMKVSDMSMATFDCRVWTVPSQWEAFNTFVWRNQDCTRNSVSMVAQAFFSHKELQGRSTMAMRSMLLDNKTPWDDYSAKDRFGRIIVKEEYLTDIEPQSVQFVDKKAVSVECKASKRTRWVAKEAWKFTEDRNKLMAMVPKYE